jgi:chemotaxis protein methyltransferase CheR
MNHSLSDIEFSGVCEVIASNMGLHFPIDRRDMVSRSLAGAARELGFHKIKEFIQWFLTTTLKSDQIEILASYLTISETYFWREPNVFTALSQNALSELVESKKESDKSIRIWCAGCSTGEEAYSIAIALCRTIPRIKDWNITILATDINKTALNKARTGIYGSWSFRNSPSWLKGYYFKKMDINEYEVIPEIKEMVSFSSFNLTNKNYLSSVCKNYKMDVIFCRNVLMYLTKEWAAKVSQNLFNSLSEKGWLVVSSCELSSELFPQYVPVNFPGAVLYRKSKKETSADIIQSKNPQNQIFFNTISSLPPQIEIVNQSVSKKTRHPEMNETVYNTRETTALQEASLNVAAELKKQEKIREDTLKENKNSIRILADQGHLEEALLVCDEAIANDKLAPGLYYLRASILQEQDKSNEAIKSLKQAIYIDPDYVMGHFTLGNLFIRQGIIKNAKRYFNNALELLNTLANDDIPAESEGLSAEYIRGIILNSLQTQKSA